MSSVSSTDTTRPQPAPPRGLPGWVRLAAGLVLIPLLLYYGVGWIQFGYRYALDLYPFLLVLTAQGVMARPSRCFNPLVVISVVINIWGAWWAMIGFSSM